MSRLTVLMILSPIWLMALHVHGCDAEISCLLSRQCDLAAPVLLAINWDRGTPSFVISNAFSDKLAQVFVNGVSWSIVRIQVGLSLMTRRQIEHFAEKVFTPVDEPPSFCIFV